MSADTRQWLGLYLGVVRAVRPADSFVRLQVPQVMGALLSNWARPVGTAVPAATGDMVGVMFLGGDINVPVYLGTISA